MADPIKIELNQESVDRMVKVLSDQKWRPVARYEFHGLRCAIGALVTPEQAKWLESHGHSIRGLIDDAGVVEKPLDHDDYLALIELQEEHDLDIVKRSSHHDRRTALRSRILKWCLRHGYEFNDPNVTQAVTR